MVLARSPEHSMRHYFVTIDIVMYKRELTDYVLRERKMYT